MSTSVPTNQPDRINGTAGRDTISGLGGADTLNGNGGADSLVGGEGADWMAGDEGADTLSDGGFDGASDTLLGGIGDDYLSGYDGSDRLEGGDGNDSLYAVEATGSNGADTLLGGDGNDTIELGNSDRSSAQMDGGAGDDLVILGNVTLPGTAALVGIERISWSGRVSGTAAGDVFDLTGFVGRLGPLGGADISGAGGGDTIIGGTGNDRLQGDGSFSLPGAGDDLLRGGTGDDTLTGGEGADTLMGGAGNDDFHLTRSWGQANGDDTSMNVESEDGNDRIVYGLDEPFVTSENQFQYHDRIYGFRPGDMLDFSAIEGMTYIGSAAFTGADREVRWTSDGLVMQWVEGGAARYTRIAVLRNEDFTGLWEPVMPLVETAPGSLLLRTPYDKEFRGTESNELLTSSDEIALMNGYGGSDTLRGAGGADSIYGGDGSDSLDGGNADDFLTSGGGSDTLQGGDGLDTAIIDGFWTDWTITTRTAPGGGFTLTRDAETKIVMGDVERINFGFGQYSHPEPVDIRPAPNGVGPSALLDASPTLAGAVEAGSDEDGNAATIQVAENTAAGTVIAILNSNDPNWVFGDYAFFEIVGPAGPFSINQRVNVVEDGSSPMYEYLQGAEIKVDGPLDFEAGPQSWTLTVRVHDFHGNTSEREVTISLLNELEAPSITTTSLSTLENTPAVGRVVGEGDGITWSLDAGVLDSDIFTIDPVTGEIAFRNVAGGDRETDAFYEVAVRATSSLGLDTQTVGITLTNVNEAPRILIPVPDLRLSSGATSTFTIPSGAVVDPDANETLTYTATLASGAALPGWLVFDPVLQRFTATPALTDVGTIEVRFRVTDQGGLYAEDIVAVTVLPTIFGTRGADTLDGTKDLGATLVGRQGSDLYLVDDTNDSVVEEAFGGADTVTASVDFTLSEEVEVLVLAGDAQRGTGNGLDNRVFGNARDNRLEGLGGNDTLTGLAGADTLDGGPGIDVMFGGLGNDLYLVDDAADRADEGSGDGFDIVRSSAITYTIGLGIERLELVGNAVEGIGAGGANYLQGNALGNVLRGLLGADTLDGGADADTMEGGIGDDVYILDNIADVAAEAPESNGDDLAIFTATNLVLGAGIERLSMTVAGTATGNALNNTITGNDTANRLRGVEGNDTINGGGGRDTLEGGNGADMLEGGTGADSLAGGLDNDIYLVVDAEDAVRELDGEGVDIVWSSADHHALANFVEDLLLVGAGRAATGNSAANRITGTGGANLLDGAGGDDSLDGAAGDDSLLGGLGADTLRGGEGADTMDGGASGDLYYVTEVADMARELDGSGNDTVLASVSYTLGAGIEDLRLLGLVEAGTGQDLANTITGNDGANLLRGMGGADRLVGGEGADTLEGGSGRDTLEGGKDVDTFLFRSVAEAEGDLILRYGKGVDKIAISAEGFGGGLVEGLALVAGETFNASRTNVATSAAGVGQFIYEQDAKALWWDADGAGGDDSVLIATFKPKPNLVPTDIIIVA